MSRRLRFLRSRRAVAVARSVLAVSFVVPATVAAQGRPAPAGEAAAAGRYLAAAAHCSACHTSRGDRPYAGNLAIPSKFGVMYSSNITSDRQTGIGGWTEAQFEGALRRGKGAHGEYLYPSMPYTDFTKISDADVHALYEYFRTVPPIAERTRKNALKFPFNVRAGVGAWQALYFRQGRYVPDPSQSAQWNRGAYLVEGLGHCGACHTPRNFAMATRNDRALQGAETGDYWFAPDISGSRFSGIRDWSEAQLVDYLKTGHNSKNVAAVGPMLETIAQGTAELSAADLQSMAVYLKNQGVAREPAPAASSPLAADRLAAGRDVYAAQCQGCHGRDGKGVDGVAPALAGNSTVTSQGAENVVHAILQGFPPNGRWGAMPSYADALDTQAIADVTNYVRNAWGQTSPANAGRRMVTRMRMDVPAPDPRVQPALFCPAVATDALDPATLAEVGKVVAGASGDSEAGPLLRRYRQRHPDVDASASITNVSGVYCRELMTRGSGGTVERQERFVRFMAALAGSAAPGRGNAR